MVQELKAGQMVKIERGMITNPDEKDTGAARLILDQVELISAVRRVTSPGPGRFSPFM